MATNAELEARLLADLAKGNADGARAVLLDPPFRSDDAAPHLRFALAAVAAAGQRADLAWLTRVSAKTKKAWSDTWMRTWLLDGLASTSALITRLLEGPTRPVAVMALPGKAHPRWLAQAGTHDLADLDGLLGGFVDGPATQIAERARALLGWPKDARIARAALAAHQGRLVSNALHPIWAAVGNLIAVHADAALRKELSGLLAEDPRLAGPYWISHWKGGADPAPRKAQSKPVAAGAPKTADEWTAWVLAAPDDLPRRALWADWLLERGDPRGELLSLQLLDRALTPKEQKRVTALVRQHGRSWIGKLTGVADAKTLQFERGVLVGCRVGAVPEGRVAADDPHWATIERLTVPSYTVVPKLFAKLLECVPRLRALEGPSIALLREALQRGAPKLERLSCTFGFRAAELPPADLTLLGGAKLPALRQLRVSGQPGTPLVKALAAMPWFEQLELLCVDGGELVDRLAAVEATRLPRIDVLAAQTDGWEPSATGFSYRATRVDGGKWKLEAIGLPEAEHTVPPDYFYETYLLPTLTRLKAGAFSDITLLVPKGLQASPKMARKVAAQIARCVGR